MAQYQIKGSSNKYSVVWNQKLSSLPLQGCKTLHPTERTKPFMHRYVLSFTVVWKEVIKVPDIYVQY